MSGSLCHNSNVCSTWTGRFVITRSDEERSLPSKVESNNGRNGKKTLWMQYCCAPSLFSQFFMVQHIISASV